MSDILVPDLPESVADATVAKWYKSEGDFLSVGDKLVDLETDKVMLEIEVETAGSLSEILKKEGDVVTAAEVLAKVDTSVKQAETDGVQDKPLKDVELVQRPSVRRLVEENNLNVDQIPATGKNNKITKNDVANFMNKSNDSVEVAAVAKGEPRRVPMSRLRAKVAERLNESQTNAVILTTFNEVDLSAVINLRKQYQESFQAKYDTKLGFMSFFVKAAVQALAEFPIINASVDGQDILYHDYFDVGVAIAAPRGLVVPVIRRANLLSMADIEKSIKNYAFQARDNKLSIEDMTGGTFTITNGGTFGSMLSTPIINPPQSAILGMHNIVERAVVVNKEIVVRPMMYLALSYDHRIIDGSDSVKFLVMIKQLLEDPARLVLNV